VQLTVGEVEICGRRESSLDEGAAFVIGPAIVGGDGANERALGLVGDCLEDVAEVLAFQWPA
jgi:hypothetical protein